MCYARVELSHNKTNVLSFFCGDNRKLALPLPPTQHTDDHIFGHLGIIIYSSFKYNLEYNYLIKITLIKITTEDIDKKSTHIPVAEAGF